MTKYEIDERTAKIAKEINSFNDYESGSATNEYNSYLTDFEKEIDDLIKRNPQNINKDTLDLIEYYKDMYAKKLAFAINKNNSIEARMPSLIICGAGNFNVRKKEKQNQARDSFYKEYGNLFSDDNYYFKKIRNIITNKTIYSDDALAIEKLETKIDKLTELQNTMKLVNAYYRKHKTLTGCEYLTDEQINKLKSSMETLTYYELPFPSFELTNNNANIHRLQDRLESLKKLKERAENPVENKYIEIEGLEVVEDSTDMRISLIFDDIPNEKVRDLLKHNGFKWSPKNNAWQRQLTNNGIYSTKRVLEQIKEMN